MGVVQIERCVCVCVCVCARVRVRGAWKQAEAVMRMLSPSCLESGYNLDFKKQIENPHISHFLIGLMILNDDIKSLV
jgi:hypothetical protein